MSCHPGLTPGGSVQTPRLDGGDGGQTAQLDTDAHNKLLQTANLAPQYSDYGRTTRYLFPL